MTTYEWDGRRMVRAVTVREPEFTERDRLLILAQRRDDDQPRNSHGVLMAEATDPANANAYEPVGPTVDFSEATIVHAQEKYARDWPDADTAGHLWGVRRKG
ncbi:hypothetical protein [Microbacterium sp. 1P06AB]|uniref:hypothetical protein n=1 Tax=Microbacterium sp. 1P06AB TaxID=3132289 RepID=UPI0039A4F0C5